MHVLIQKKNLNMLFLWKGSSIKKLRSIGVVEQQIIPAGGKPTHFGRSRDHFKTSHIWYQMKANKYVTLFCWGILISPLLMSSLSTIFKHLEPNKYYWFSFVYRQNLDKYHSVMGGTNPHLQNLTPTYNTQPPPNFDIGNPHLHS